MSPNSSPRATANETSLTAATPPHRPLPEFPLTDEVRADRPDRCGQHRARREREDLVVGRVDALGGGGELVDLERVHRAAGPGAFGERPGPEGRREQRDCEPHVL